MRPFNPNVEYLPVTCHDILGTKILGTPAVRMGMRIVYNGGVVMLSLFPYYICNAGYSTQIYFRIRCININTTAGVIFSKKGTDIKKKCILFVTGNGYKSKANLR